MLCYVSRSDSKENRGKGSMEILYILVPSVAIPLAIALLFFFICVCRNNQKASRPPAARQPKPVRGQNVEMSMFSTAYKPKVRVVHRPPERELSINNRQRVKSCLTDSTGSTDGPHGQQAVPLTGNLRTSPRFIGLNSVAFYREFHTLGLKIILHFADVT